MSERYTKFVAGKLQKSGFENIQILSPNEEISADLLAMSKSGAKVCIKCCYSTQPVTAKAVQAVLQAKRYYKCNASMIVTNNTFTDKAKAYAAENKTVLKENIAPPQSAAQPQQKTSPATKSSKKNILPFVIVGLAVLSIIAIPIGIHMNSSEETSNANNNPQEVSTSIDGAEEIKALGDISVDEGLLNVDITFPAEFIGETTQEDIEKEAKENGYKSAVLNADGSVTYTMTKKQHKELMEETSKGFRQQLSELVGSEDYPNFTNVQANDDFTRFEVTTTSSELSWTESFSTLQFYMMSAMYHTLNGTKVDNCQVVFINADTGVIISEANSSEALDEEETPDNLDASNSATSKNENNINTSNASINETILLDEAGVKITAKSLENDGTFGPALKLLIENNASQNLTIQTRSCSVNGYMIGTMLSSDVTVGKKSNDELIFSSSDLEACGIDTIADMELSFHIFNSESWDTYLDTELISLTTDAAESYTYTYDDSGELLYDGNGIKIIHKGLAESDSLFGPEVLLYIYNGNTKNITVQTADTSINGFMVSSVISEEVAIGKHAIAEMTFFSSELEENAITDITDIELSFHVFDTDTWDTIVDTEPITINY